MHRGWAVLLAGVAACSWFHRGPSLSKDAGDVVAAVNRGTDGAISAFLEARAAKVMWNQMSPAQYAPVLRRLAADSGGLEIVHPMIAPPRTSAVLVRSRRGGRLLAIRMACDDDSRIARISLQPMPFDPRQPPPDPWRPDGPLDEAERTALIDRNLGQAIAGDLFSGTVLIAQGGRVVYERSAGLADRERGDPNTVHTRHAIGSMGKMLTAVAVAQLVEQGKLRFGDSLASILPDYPNADAARRITVHQLLTHTAGLGDPFDSPRYHRAAPVARQSDWFPLFAPQPPASEPGTRFSDGNGGYAVLGAVVERLSGQSLEAYLREHVYAKAGMNDVLAGTPVSTGYYRPWTEDPLGVRPRRPNTDFIGARKDRCSPSGFGGECLSAQDLLQFARALRDGGLVSPALRDALIEGRVESDQGPEVRYGYGFYVLHRPGEVNVSLSGGGEGSGIDGDLELLWNAGTAIVAVGNYDAPSARQIAGPLAGMLMRQNRVASR